MRFKKLLKRTLSIVIVLSMLTMLMGSFAYAATNVPITFKYDDFTNVSKLKLNGTATQMTSANPQSIRITDNKTNQNGSFFSGNYVSLANDRSFSTMFSFLITNPGGIGQSGADGIEFVINTNTNNLGAVGGGIGYTGIVNSLGVEFDTWDNGTAFGDTGLKENHVAININGDSTAPIKTIKEDAIEALYKVPKGTFNFGNGTGNGNKAPAQGSEKTYFAWIDYDGKSKVLSVRMNSNSNVRPDKAILTQSIDLATNTTLTTDKVYVGFTGATGSAYSKEYIKSWYFNNDFITESIDPVKNTYIEYPNITLSANPDTNTQTSLVTAVVKNDDGSVAPNIPVTFSILSGPDATFTTPTTVITDSNGIATAFLDGSNVPVGTIVVNAAIDAAHGGKNATTTVTNFGKSDIQAVITDSTINVRQNNTYQFTGKEFTDNFSSNINSIKIISLPASAVGTFKNNGTAVKVGDVIPAISFNVLTFVASASYVGSQPIKWQATSDGTKYSSTANLNVNVLPNHAPEATNYNLETLANTPVTGKIVATDSDNDSLTYLVSTQPTNGTVSVNVTTGEFTYTPNNNVTGTDSFAVKISDGNGGTTTSTVNINIVKNDPPVTSDLNLNTGTNTPVLGTITATDPDNDTLAYTLSTVPTKGAVDINESTGTFTYTPNNNEIGEDTFKVTVSDGKGGVAVSTVKIKMPDSVGPPSDIPLRPRIYLTFDYAYLYGYEQGPVGADDTVKREEASALLYRLLKQDGKTAGFVPPETSAFSDLKKGRWSFNAIEYMTSIGVFDPSNGTVKPAGSITRGEASKIIAYAMGLQPNPRTLMSFTDITQDNKYYSCVKALVDEGILVGYADNTIHPNGNLTRAEYVTMINRLIGRDNRYNIDNEPNLYPDITSAHWAYKDIMRASLGFSQNSSGNFVVDPAKRLKRNEIDYN